MGSFSVTLPDGTNQSFDANVTATATQLPAPIPGPTPAPVPTPIPQPVVGPSDVVIDLSDYDQVTPNWSQVWTSGIQAVILKATEIDQTNGRPFVDSTFISRAKGATDAGLLVGAYGFFTGASVDQQMSLFLATSLPLTSFLVLDFLDVSLVTAHTFWSQSRDRDCQGQNCPFSRSLLQSLHGACP